jgi:hypothetical protein
MRDLVLSKTFNFFRPEWRVNFSLENAIPLNYLHVNKCTILRRSRELTHVCSAEMTHLVGNQALN